MAQSDIRNRYQSHIGQKFRIDNWSKQPNSVWQAVNRNTITSAKAVWGEKNVSDWYRYWQTRQVAVSVPDMKTLYWANHRKNVQNVFVKKRTNIIKSVLGIVIMWSYILYFISAFRNTYSIIQAERETAGWKMLQCLSWVQFSKVDLNVSFVSNSHRL